MGIEFIVTWNTKMAKKKKQKNASAIHALYETAKEAGMLFFGRVTPRGFKWKNKRKEQSKGACRGKHVQD